MCPRARKQKIMQEFDWRIRALGRGRERKGEACLLTLHLLELDIRTPGRGFTRGSYEGPWRSSMRDGEKWRIPSHNPQAESGGL